MSGRHRFSLWIIVLAGLAVAAAAQTAGGQRPPRTTTGESQKAAGQSQPRTMAQEAVAGRLRPGEAAIYLRDGRLVIDKIIDISSTRLVLETAKSGEFGLDDIFLVNYEAEAWNYPAERDRVGNHEPSIFTKDNRQVEGRIIDFSSTRLVYELEGGGEVPANDVRRIYFTPQVPRELTQGQTGGAGTRTDGRIDGRTMDGRVASGAERTAGGATKPPAEGRVTSGRGGVAGDERPRLDGPAGERRGELAGTWTLTGAAVDPGDARRVRGFQLTLERNGDAAMAYRTGWGRKRTVTGSWRFDRAEGEVIVDLNGPGGREILTFGREDDLLIGRTYNRMTYGTLRLRRLAGAGAGDAGTIRR